MHNDSIWLPRGKILGGSNELNAMIHCKGTPGDYNGWANFTGDDSWRYE